MIRRAAGFLGTILGAIGLLASLAGIVKTWQVEHAAQELVEQVAQQVETGLSVVDEKAQEVNQVLANAQDYATGFNDQVQGFVARKKEIPTTEAPDLDEIERQLFARLQLSRDWISAASAGIELINQLVSILEAAQVVSPDETATQAEIVARARAGRDELDAVFAVATELRTELAKLAESRDLEANAGRIQTLSGSIAQALDRAIEAGQKFEAGISDAKVDVERITRRVQGSIRGITVLLTCLLGWSGLAQLTLLLAGFRLLRGQDRKAKVGHSAKS